MSIGTGASTVSDLLRQTGRLAARSWGVTSLTETTVLQIGKALARQDFVDLGILAAIGNDVYYQRELRRFESAFYTRRWMAPGIFLGRA